MNDMNLSIGEFSKLTGISIYTLRYYEKENLIQPQRLGNGHRYYSDDDMKWIAFIKRLKDTGMPLKEIKHYAMLRQHGDATLEERMMLLVEHRANLQQQMSHLEMHLHKLDEKIGFYQEQIKNKV